MLVKLSNLRLCLPPVSGDKNKTNQKIHEERLNRLNCACLFCSTGSASWLSLRGDSERCEERK